MSGDRVAPSVGGGLFFYRRLASPLHAARAGVGALWAVAVGAAALVLYHPLALLALLAGVLGAAWGAGVAREMRRAVATALVVAIPIVAVNVLVSRQGLTVFARLGDLGPFGQGDLTLEALAYGALVALKVAIMILAATLASLAVDPDELLRGVRRLSFRSALTATVAIRMIPLLAADARRLVEAQRTRPPTGPSRGPARARARLAVVTALLAGALDRATDVAATLEVRGIAAGRRPQRMRRSLSRHDIAFAAAALALIALAIALAAAAPFDAYPLLRMRFTPAVGLLCAGLLAALLLPFCDRRGIER
jgi:energy-coupling factor transport system permease protein